MKSTQWQRWAFLLTGAAIGWSLRSVDITPAFRTTAQAQEPLKTQPPPAAQQSGQPKPAQEAAVQQAPADEAAVTDAALESPLMTLDWLAGEWVGENDQGRIEISSHYSKNNSFLIRSFRALKADESVYMSGIQILGWDPVENSMRSWVFDSEGGFGEDRSTQVDQRYTCRSQYTMSDGSLGASMQSITYVDDDTFLWQSVQREINGELLPDVAEVVVKRISEDTVAPASTQEGGKE